MSTHASYMNCVKVREFKAFNQILTFPTDINNIIFEYYYRVIILLDDCINNDIYAYYF